MRFKKGDCVRCQNAVDSNKYYYGTVAEDQRPLDAIVKVWTEAFDMLPQPVDWSITLVTLAPLNTKLRRKNKW